MTDVIVALNRFVTLAVVPWVSTAQYSTALHCTEPARRLRGLARGRSRGRGAKVISHVNLTWFLWPSQIGGTRRGEILDAHSLDARLAGRLSHHLHHTAILVVAHGSHFFSGCGRRMRQM